MPRHWLAQAHRDARLGWVTLLGRVPPCGVTRACGSVSRVNYAVASSGVAITSSVRVGRAIGGVG